jgi:hypothetical protein
MATLALTGKGLLEISLLFAARASQEKIPPKVTTKPNIMTANTPKIPKMIALFFWRDARGWFMTFSLAESVFSDSSFETSTDEKRNRN